MKRIMIVLALSFVGIAAQARPISVEIERCGYGYDRQFFCGRVYEGGAAQLMFLDSASNVSKDQLQNTIRNANGRSNRMTIDGEVITTKNSSSTSESKLLIKNLNNP